MMLALAYQWPVRCGRCGHKGEVSASTAELAIKLLRCARCDHVQSFAPETVRALKRATRRRRVSWRSSVSPAPVAVTADLNDRLDDLWAG
jgi:hypothetical protein